MTSLRHHDAALQFEMTNHVLKQSISRFMLITLKAHLAEIIACGDNFSRRALKRDMRHVDEKSKIIKAKNRGDGPRDRMPNVSCRARRASMTPKAGRFRLKSPTDNIRAQSRGETSPVRLASFLGGKKHRAPKTWRDSPSPGMSRR